jgi:hypothetical protein
MKYTESTWYCWLFLRSEDSLVRVPFRTWELQKNRSIRCFDAETIGATALAPPSLGRLLSYSYGRSGAGRACSPSCWSFSASVSAGCRRRLPDTSIRRQSDGGRTAAKSDVVNNNIRRMIQIPPSECWDLQSIAHKHSFLERCLAAGTKL